MPGVMRGRSLEQALLPLAIAVVSQGRKTGRLLNVQCYKITLRAEWSIVMTSLDSDEFLSKFLRTHEAGAFLKVSPRTLEKLRITGGGPLYRKLGGRVVYALADLQAWADAGTKRHTADPLGGHPAPLRWRAKRAHPVRD